MSQIKQNALYIDASSKSYNLEDIKDDFIIGPIDFGYKQWEKDKNSFCFGAGSLAWSPIPGTRRMMLLETHLCGEIFTSQPWEEQHLFLQN
jgi:hypothetical protein